MTECRVSRCSVRLRVVGNLAAGPDGRPCANSDLWLRMPFLGSFMVAFLGVGIGSRTAGRLQRRLRCRRRPDPHPRSFCDDWICRFSPSGMQVTWSANVAQGRRSATCSRQARPLLKLRTEANTQCHSFSLAFREQAQSPAPENHFEDSRRVRFRKV